MLGLQSTPQLLSGRSLAQNILISWRMEQHISRLVRPIPPSPSLRKRKLKRNEVEAEVKVEADLKLWLCGSVGTMTMAMVLTDSKAFASITYPQIFTCSGQSSNRGPSSTLRCLRFRSFRM